MVQAPVENPGMQQLVRQTLERERQDVITWMNWIRLMGVSFWLSYAFFISQRPSSAQPSTQIELPFLCLYLLLSLLMLGAGYLKPIVRKYSVLAITLLDIPFVFVMRYFSMMHSSYPDSAMNFTLSIFIMLVACTFLTLEPWAIIGSALMVSVLQGYLHYARGMANHDWNWWSLIPVLIILLITCLTSVYATRRLLGMVYRVAQEQETLEAQRRANAELENKVSFVNQLASNLTHDLKSPLSSCYNLVQGLLSSLGKTPQADPRQLSQQLKKLTRSFDKLNQYIAISLDRDMLEQGKLVLRQEAIDLQQVCEDVLELHADYAIHADVAIILALPAKKIRLKGDALRFEHVLSNLVSNGLRFADTELKLSAVIAGSTVIVKIINDGESIPPELLSHLFERYATARLSQPTAGSTGLGLAISKSYIEMMGGEIQVESIPEQTVITLRMPIWEEAES